MDFQNILDTMTPGQRQAVNATIELWSKESSELRARIAELEAERAELVKDRERLDWLAANWYRFEYFTLPDGRFQWAFRETGKGGRADTFRAAIDAAREGEWIEMPRFLRRNDD